MMPLPNLLAEIAAIAGLKSALAIARAKGGARAYFPSHPGPGHWLSHLVGLDTARKIGEHLATGQGGVELEVPLGPILSQRARWQKMQDMRAQGYSKPRIARALGCHEKTVQRVVNGQRKTVAAQLAQGELQL